MTQKPKAKQDAASGKWLRNHARANADFNASQVIRKRGVQPILSGGYSPKAQKRIMAMRKKTKPGVEPTSPRF